MQSTAPSPCFFIISRARSVRYLRMRSQLTRCCQSKPAMPKFAPINALPSFGACAPHRLAQLLAGRLLPCQSTALRMTCIRSGRFLAGIGREAGGLNARDGTYLIVIGGVARDTDRADHVAILVADQDARRARHQPPVAHRGERREECRLLGRAAGERARAEPHAERAPGLPERNVETQNAGLVLTLECDQMPAGVEHRDRERHELVLAPGLERGVDDG